MDIIFPATVDRGTRLSDLAAHCSSLGRVRVLALIVKLVSVSSSAATAIYKLNLLSLLEAEVNMTNDLLMTKCLELLYEVISQNLTCLWFQSIHRVIWLPCSSSTSSF